MPNLFKLLFVVLTSLITGLTLFYYFKDDVKLFYIFFFLFMLAYVTGVFIRDLTCPKIDNWYKNCKR